MTCLHGFDNVSCPICRLAKSTVPNDLRKLNYYNLKPESSFIKQNATNKEQFLNDLIPKKAHTNINCLSLIPKPLLMNEIPNFENKMLKQRLEEIDIAKSDLFGISKKIPLESPELKFKEKE